MDSPAKPASPKKSAFEDYEVEDALRALERTAELEDRPELLAAVQKKAGRKVKALSSILGKTEAPEKPKIRNMDDLRKAAKKRF